MLRNNLKVAVRRLMRSKLFSSINTIGLVVGMTCTLLISFWVKNELTYDQFHERSEDIYRVELSSYQDESFEETSSITQFPMGPELQENFAAVEDFVRLRGAFPGGFAVDDHYVELESIIFADSGFLDVFSFKLIEGNAKEALKLPNSIILTPASANKIFGSQDVVGKSILYDGEKVLQVTGIIEPAPDNSHIVFDAILSFQTLTNFCTKWDCNYSFYTYIKTTPGTDAGLLAGAFPDFMWERLNKSYSQFNYREDIFLRPLNEIHLYSNSYEMQPPGSLGLVNLMIAIAVFILLIACINFINLNMAQISKRGIEIGIKKASGASRRQVINQVFTEISLQTIIALVLALVVTEMTLPGFNALLGTSFSLLNIDPVIAVTVLSILILTMILSGLYPAILLARQNPVSVLKGSKLDQGSGFIFRNFLLVVQLVTSISLIACTVIVLDQLKYLSLMDLGFEKENVVDIPLPNEEASEKYELLLQDFTSLSSVISAGACTEVPGYGFTQNGYLPEGLDDPMMIHALDVDDGYLDAMGIDILQGRSFDTGRGTDEEAVIINETLQRQLGWSNPIGKLISRNGIDHPVIGVVNDFHFNSAHSSIQPLIISTKPWGGNSGFGSLAVRIQGADLPSTINELKDVWSSHISSIPFDFEFIDERFNQLYNEEKKLAALFIYFTIVAITISGLGVFALILFIVDQKTKEIGIRKVLGASVAQILGLLSRGFLIRIVLACLLAVPITYMVMQNWLENFAYRISPSTGHFITAVIVVLVVSLLAIAHNSIRAAQGNPVNALRSE